MATLAQFEIDSAAAAMSAGTADSLLLPPSSFADSLLRELEYFEGEPPMGLEADLNGDGLPDWIVRSATRLCGNGGCPLVVVTQNAAGAMRVLSHEFAGTTYIMRHRVSGWSVIWLMNSGGYGRATIGRLVFDGTSYEFNAIAELDETALLRWRSALSQPFNE